MTDSSKVGATPQIPITSDSYLYPLGRLAVGGVGAIFTVALIFKSKVPLFLCATTFILTTAGTAIKLMERSVKQLNLISDELAQSKQLIGQLKQQIEQQPKLPRKKFVTEFKIDS